MSKDDFAKRLQREIQPELDRMLTDHARTMRLIDAMPEPTDEQRRAIAEASSPEGWRRALADLMAETTPKTTVKGGAMRTFGIWFFGLLASAIIGGLVGSAFNGPYGGDNGVWGALATMLVFACARLWLGQPRES